MAFYANQPLPDTNARAPAVTVRPSSTALLTIDSEDRYKDYIEARANPSSPYNFSIRKNENLMSGFFTRLAVTEINFPWTIPNINEKTDTILVGISVSGGPVVSYTLTIPQGFYTPSELAVTLQNDIADLSNSLVGFTMTYGIRDGFTGDEPVFEYNTNDANVLIKFNPVPYNTSIYPYNSQSKQLFDLLGFAGANSILQETLYGGYTLCQAIRYIDIVCNQLTSVSALKDQTSQTVARDMLCRIYLGDGGGSGQSTTRASAIDYTDASGTITNAFCPPGCAPMTIYRNFTLPKQIQWIPNQNIPGFLQFQVYDDAGDLLDTSIVPPNIPIGDYTDLNTNWSMTILVSEN